MVEINPKIFKAYDIRGVFGEDMDNESGYKIGRAFAEMIKSELKKDEITIAVGRDMRVSSPELTKRVIAGITEQGVNVVDIGLASTPTFYFAVGNYDYDAGIQVSASHNPGKYNGFKMVRQKAVPVSGETGIMDLRDAVIADDFTSSDKKGSVSLKEGVIKEHVDYALKSVDVSKLKPFKIVLDTANSMGGPLFTELFKHLPGELIHINPELDGTFPGHEADPIKEENNRQLQEKVLEVGADFGIVTDGDCDRIFYVTNEGKTVEAGIVRGILASLFLRDNPGAKVGYDIRPGKITEDLILENGGEPFVTRVGHSLIKEKMREVDAVFAGESSGHFFLKMPFGTFEAPMIMTLKLMEELTAVGGTVSEYVKPLQKYHHSGEINFEVEDKQAMLDKLRETYSENLQYDFDGLSFKWENWWFNVRPSNTENKLRLNLEATTKEVMEEKRDEVSNILKSK